jgi:hypothetical protein
MINPRRPDPVPPEVLARGEQVQADLSDEDWHEAACSRAAAQRTLAVLTGVRTVGEARVPAASQRRLFDGPGQTRLDAGAGGGFPPQPVAVAVAAGQHAAHQVVATRRGEDDADAVVSLWAAGFDHAVLRRLQGAWHWQRARADARLVLSEPAVYALVRETVSTLRSQRQMQAPLFGDPEPQSLPLLHHRIWDPEHPGQEDLARTDLSQPRQWRHLTRTLSGLPLAVIRRHLESSQASWDMAGRNDDDAVDRGERLEDIAFDLRYLAQLEIAAADAVPDYPHPGAWYDLRVIDLDGYTVPLAGELLHHDTIHTRSDQGGQDPWQARVQVLTVLPMGESVPMTIWADRVTHMEHRF